MAGNASPRREPGRNRRVVGGRRGERLRGEPPPRLGRKASRAQLGEHLRVALRPADGRDPREVLRCGPEQRRPADVDHLDHVGLGGAFARGGLGEGIEVDDDEVEGLDPVRLEVGEVAGHVPAGQDAAVHRGVQRDHAVTEHLGEAGQALHPRHGQAVLLQVGGGAAARHQLAAQLVEPARTRPGRTCRRRR